MPSAPGTYSLNVTYGGRRVPGSPFRVPVVDAGGAGGAAKGTADAGLVKCAGPGLSKGEVRVNAVQRFDVDCSKAGEAPLDVKVVGPKGGSGGLG